MFRTIAALALASTTADPATALLPCPLVGAGTLPQSRVMVSRNRAVLN